MRYSKINIAWLLAAAPLIEAHSWVEKLNVIAPNGTFIGPDGFMRGNIQRGEGFSDLKLQNLVRGAATDPMCRDTQKTPDSQTPGNPRLNAPAGAAVALRYQENGHVTLPDSPVGKAKNRGDVYIYGTTQPKDNEMFNDVHGQWTADGKGGDGRGLLLLKADYDDGQCYQVNGGAISQERQKEFGHPLAKDQGSDLWCQNDFRLPVDAPTGQPYTVYWVWDWSTEPTAELPNGMNETYTSCIDIDIAENSGSNKASDEAYSYTEGQDLANAAVAKQFNNLANAPVGGDQPAATSASESQSSSQSSAASSTSSAQSAAQSTFETSTRPAATSSAAASMTIEPIPDPETSSSTSQESSTTSSSPPAASSVEGAAGDAPFSAAPIPGSGTSQTAADSGKAVTSDAPAPPMGPATTITITDLVTTTMTGAPQKSNVVVPTNSQPTTMKTVVRR